MGSASLCPSRVGRTLLSAAVEVDFCFSLLRVVTEHANGLVGRRVQVKAADKSVRPTREGFTSECADSLGMTEVKWELQKEIRHDSEF
jgi:hypothetical protein